MNDVMEGKKILILIIVVGCVLSAGLGVRYASSSVPAGDLLCSTLFPGTCSKGSLPGCADPNWRAQNCLIVCWWYFYICAY